MVKFVKPVVVVSQCLEFDKCRYNGAMIPSQFVRRLQKHVQFKIVCPEVQIGLGIPRDPIKLIRQGGKIKLVQPSTNRDLTKKMIKFSDHYLSQLQNVDGFILKYGSPSCGINNVKIYPKMDKSAPIAKGPGMFASYVLEKFPGLAIEDEGHLTNLKIREHFLTKLFLFANFRNIKNGTSVSTLVDFHARNKLILMAYNQKALRLLGQIVANPQRRKLSELFLDYEKILKDAFNRNARYTSHINVLMHALGYFKNQISAQEKKFFLTHLDKYRNEIISLSVLRTIIQAWAIKYHKEYLLQQTYFQPYPEDLVDMRDSGKGRNDRY